MEGEAKDVLNNGGLVDLRRTELDISTTPRNIPDEIVVDVSEMDMDTVITIGDVQAPAGTTIEGEPEWVVVTVLTMRAAVEEAAAGDAEGDEGEAATDGGDSAGAADGGDDAGE